jgi:hypothetical protein
MKSRKSAPHKVTPTVTLAMSPTDYEALKDFLIKLWISLEYDAVEYDTH